MAGVQEGAEIRDAVRRRYAGFARTMGREGCCAGDGSCCGGAADGAVPLVVYSPEDLQAAFLAGGASLGCGNPVATADLRPGEVVLDLGSGAGLDVLLAARRVGPQGTAYGLDMTDEMLALALANRRRAGVFNAHFLRGQIEAIPLPDQAVDVVISNCVINLSADKLAALREAYRVLRPGGRFRVADMVEVEPLPDALRSSLESWAGCIAGALEIDRYRELLEEAGFRDITFEELHTYRGKDVGAAGLPGAVASMLVSANRPLDA